MNNNCICKIRKIYRCISEFELQLQKAFGLNFNEAMLLCVLSEKEKMLSGEIATSFSISRSKRIQGDCIAREGGLHKAQRVPT